MSLLPSKLRESVPSTSETLTVESRRVLLAIARHAVVLAVERLQPLEVVPAPGVLAEPAGAFVTLWRRGRLRGCVGQMEPAQSLANVVAHCALSAALADPRFRPVTSAELSEIDIEISVLSPFHSIRVQEIRIGVHGLLVTKAERRGLLLPQVAAEREWSVELFVAETCAKAGLPRDAWKDADTQILGFTAEVFSEVELATQCFGGKS